ncbi:protein of unknown function [Bartonella clarridgeiae 73]|uniref:Uncharacterized protein n=1 Tax=Bartonella clarridgeiae (strain CCUG 45776 / CIP 104772 / 73) TaxID=696125 RepID=E6YI35_BARC7|nr:MAG: hypothetical protein PG977_000297 [Bartonella clarridgeiae]CBI76523.1 protein of unknown function [Bartonella clarridgeiae 73]
MWEHIKKIEKAEQKKQHGENISDNVLTSYLAQVKSAQPADQERGTRVTKNSCYSWF